MLATVVVILAGKCHSLSLAAVRMLKYLRATVIVILAALRKCLYLSFWPYMPFEVAVE